MRVIAISRQVGAGETSVAPAVARELGWRCVDREMLERQVAETGVTLPRIAHFDEHAPSPLESWTKPGEAERYFDALKRIVLRLANDENAIVVGRGAGFMLRGLGAIHVRLVADLPFRVQRVMEIRWLAEGPARNVIRQSDADRAAYHRKFFGVDWNDPLQYDLVACTSRLGLEKTTGVLCALGRSLE